MVSFEYVVLPKSTDYCSDRDVYGFSFAIESMRKFWVERNLDCFKQGQVSLAGLAHRDLLSPDRLMASDILNGWPKGYEFLHEFVRRGILGGIVLFRIRIAVY